MKQLVIIIGTTLLGCIIFNMMAGSSPDSLKSVSAAAIEMTLNMYG